MATWKKVIVSGSSISQLNNDAGYLTAITAQKTFSTMSFGGTALIADVANDTISFVSSSTTGLKFSADAGTDTVTMSLEKVPNASLANSSVTVTAGSGLANGGSVSLGGSVTLNIGQGTGIIVNTDDVALKNAGSLSGNTVLKWDSGNGQLVNSLITDNGSTVTIGGNLQVNGTTTVVNTTNLTVTDQFILLGSGSVADKEGGIIVQSAAGAGSGFAYFLDSITSPRWGFSSSVSATTTPATTPDEYVVSAKLFVGTWTATSAAPTYGGTGAGYGNMVIDNTDIWIYA